MDEWPWAVLVFYIVGMLACARVLISKAWGDKSAVFACLMVLLIWPIIACDVIDIDREDKGY